jgi:hypothetical protein
MTEQSDGEVERYALTNGDGETMQGETYEDYGNAVFARARLMNEHPDGEDITVKAADGG